MILSLANVKTLLDIKGSERDEQLQLIMDMVEKQLLRKLPGETAVPAVLDYIVTEVTIIRFNRLGSEGMTQHSQEGLAITYQTDDFAPYTSDINGYLEPSSQARRGKVRFL